MSSARSSRTGTVRARRAARSFVPSSLRPSVPSSSAFTLVELLVAIGIIAVLGALTVIAVRAIAADARLATGENTVAAALDTARTEALKRGKIVLVTFRPRLLSEERQVVEAVFSEYSGESYWNQDVGGLIDRFVPFPDVPSRQLPAGVKVAAPRYGDSYVAGAANFDDYWFTQAHLPAIDPENPIGPQSERPGHQIGIMYGPDGALLARNPRSTSDRMWVDFNDDGGIDFRDEGPIGPSDLTAVGLAFEQWLERNETFVVIAPFLSVYDDREAREVRATNWASAANYEQELTGPGGYITRLGKRIHFNRYTGVILTTEVR